MVMFLKDFFFPKLCLGCNALGSYICSNCQRKLELIDKDICVYCERGSYMGLTHPGCKKKNGVDGMITFYRYNLFMKKVIKHIKYKLAIDVFKEFCQIIQPEVNKKLIFYKQLSKNGLLQPIPLHSSKQKLRGFNQALLIGRFFNMSLQLPVTDYFKRTKETLPQAEIKQKKDRYLNIKGAFQPHKYAETRGKTIIITDDVITTGYTVLEFSKALKQNGALKVFAIALAKG